MNKLNTNKNWKNNELQFARLIVAMGKSEAFFDNNILDCVCKNMDISCGCIEELIARAKKVVSKGEKK